MWKNFDTKFGGILKNLARHKNYVEGSATLAHYQKYQEDTRDLNKKLDELIDEEQQKKSIAVSDWLAVGRQPQKYHEDFRRIREPYPTTAQWILGNDHIKGVLGKDVPATPIVWINGIPGAGMTSIMTNRYHMRSDNG
jgi:hypothetical protein